MSLPARGAWIEIGLVYKPHSVPYRRSPQGERGLKLFASKKTSSLLSRSPQGERGLKSNRINGETKRVMSLPARGAWIEINGGNGIEAYLFASLPARGAWIEMKKPLQS